MPFYIGKIASAQDKFEIFDFVFRQCLLTPSWWFGHRATNGILAKNADIEFKKDHGIDGVFVESKTHERNNSDSTWGKLKKYCPEPTKV